ncbi:MAG TPA: hypothetical protein VFU46_08760 [Gemmatimonadales bacterium]|nr:hypothetical protein [Gemmatimonadales bacterium]
MRLADHFAGKPPVLRVIFETRIVFQARVRFGGVAVRRQWLELRLWLHRRADHPALVRVGSFGRLGYGHYFRLRAAADLDATLSDLIGRAYDEARTPGPAAAGLLG